MALAMSFLQLITAEDSCASETFHLQIVTKSCEDLSVVTKINDIVDFLSECGEAADGIDGVPILGVVDITLDKILEPTKFWFYKGPKDNRYQYRTEVSVTHHQGLRRLSM